MMSDLRRWSALGLPVAMLVVLAVLAVSFQASAQADSPHPAHIHEGSCDNLGDVVAPLDNVSFAEASQVEGSASAIPVKVSDTDVELSLSDILANPHAINIHESDDNIQEYIACGDIGGPVRDGELLIGLRQLNESGHTGVAILEEDDEETKVEIYLIEPGTVEVADQDLDAATDDGDSDDAAEATEAAAVDADDAAEDDDTSAAPAGQEVAVDIVNFAFNPDPIEIAVGDTVTWTNQDGVPHTATGQDRDVLQSGTIAPGGSFSHTFTEAGEISYFCEFHNDMSGTIIVQ